MTSVAVKGQAILFMDYAYGFCRISRLARGTSLRLTRISYPLRPPRCRWRLRGVLAPRSG